jgi:hypothetical protein
MSQWSLDRLLCNACENFRREGILMQQGAQIDSDEDSSRPNSPQVDRPLADDFAELQDSFLANYEWSLAQDRAMLRKELATLFRIADDDGGGSVGKDELLEIFVSMRIQVICLLRSRPVSPGWCVWLADDRRPMLRFCGAVCHVAVPVTAQVTEQQIRTLCSGVRSDLDASDSAEVGRNFELSFEQLEEVWWKMIHLMKKRARLGTDDPHRAHTIELDFENLTLHQELPELFFPEAALEPELNRRTAALLLNQRTAALLRSTTNAQVKAARRTCMSPPTHSQLVCPVFPIWSIDCAVLLCAMLCDILLTTGCDSVRWGTLPSVRRCRAC